ncbi:hypothetical protein A2U01_0106633, partial [Trifolium medium]|nr:hypothetical protein [Trifolium medium]
MSKKSSTTMTRIIQIYSKRTPQPPTKPTTRAKEHPDTNQIRRKTKVMSPENWEEG